jgi:hypothetical protein
MVCLYRSEKFCCLIDRLILGCFSSFRALGPFALVQLTYLSANFYSALICFSRDRITSNVYGLVLRAKDPGHHIAESCFVPADNGIHPALLRI